MEMSLKDKFSAQLKEAMKSRDSVRLGCLRMIISAVKNAEIEKRGELDEAETMKVLTKLAKQRSESIEMYRKGGRDELVQKETAELEIVKSFLPEPLSDEELAKLVEDAIAEVEASEPKDMGKVMKAIGPKVTGRADGKKVSDAVKSKLLQS